MHTVVNEGLGNVKSGNTGLLLEIAQIQNELMHADTVKGGGEGALDLALQVVGVENCILGSFGNAFLPRVSR
jgi:hypothetical protein